MRPLRIIGALVLVGAVMTFGACERKVVIEHADAAAETSCFTCHSDQDIFLVAAELQWEHSKHASGENTNRNRLNSPSNETCEQCHTHEGFLARPEVTGIPATGDQFTVIGCFTCHAPHTNGDFRLRIEEPITLLNGATYDKGRSNICAACHHSRSDVGTAVVAGVKMNNRFGPHHSNQSDMLSGENAYEFAGYTYTSSAHRNVTTQGCVDCHMQGGVSIFVGQHTFKMIDEETGFENTIGCNASTCHDGSPVSKIETKLADADFDWDGTIEPVQTEIEGLLDSLNIVLTAAGLLTSDLPTNNLTVNNADSAGAVYNFVFVEEDRSKGIHNTDYTVGLLQSSINYMVHGNPNGSPTLSAFIDSRNGSK